MNIKILGAHNIESRDTRHVTLLVDGVMSIDAASLTSSLTFDEQQKLKAVLITHQHYDHLRDIPALGMNFSLHGNSIEVYAPQPVYEALAANLLNDSLYPNFFVKPPEKPAVRFNLVEPDRTEAICGYRVTAVTVNHSVPGIGYQVTSADGRTFFYTSDTGTGLDECWQKVSPELLIIETTAPNSFDDFARRASHLTPALLQTELESFLKIKSYLPQIVLVHMNPIEQKEIEAEIDAVARSLDTRIQLGYEGMEIAL